MKLKNILYSIIALAIGSSSTVSATEAFFNPHPPPTVYEYNRPQGGSGYVTPTYVPPGTASPSDNTYIVTPNTDRNRVVTPRPAEPRGGVWVRP